MTQQRSSSVTAELLPCPFCGGEARSIKGQHNFEDVEVCCLDCGTSGPTFDNDVAVGGSSVDPASDAMKHWNTRIPAQLQQWQPIETAPRDGTPILAVNSRHPIHSPVVVRWDANEVEDETEPHWCDAATRDGSALYYNRNYFDFWVACPAFPSTDKGAGHGG